MDPGEARILVVDDEPAVLETVRDGLNSQGYRVVLTPDAKVLFMSGFSTEVVVVHGIKEGDPVIVKPFSLETLKRKIQELLEVRRSPFPRPPQPPGR